MSTTDVSSETSTETPEPGTTNMKREVVNVPSPRSIGQSTSTSASDSVFADGEDLSAVQYTPLHDASDAAGRRMEEVLHVLPR
jgi:hypothetical protein